VSHLGTHSFGHLVAQLLDRAVRRTKLGLPTPTSAFAKWLRAWTNAVHTPGVALPRSATTSA
jgi:hypothetical protein